MKSTFVILLFLFFSVLAEKVEKYETCVIGGGPGGIQMGYFLKKSNRNYVVLEKNNVPCSFFTKYPRQGNLISINKRYVEFDDKEYKLRHDWNSLLSDDPELVFTKYSEDYFPKSKLIPKYCKDYVNKLNINIHFGTYVNNMSRLNKHKKITIPKGDFILRTNKKTYQCQRVVMATGFQQPVQPQVFKGLELTDNYATMSFDKKEFINKKVLIFGKGNSAMEVINHITPFTQYIHVMSPHKIRLSYFTHYVGDIRAVNNHILDQYQLKSLDAIGDANAKNSSFSKTKDGRIQFSYPDNGDSFDQDELHPLVYDKVIFCTGFTFNGSFLPDDPLDQPIFSKGKYPVTNSFYESVNVPDLYVAGTIAHLRDLRKSAGGFIHGFRYLAQTVNSHMEWRYHDVVFPHKTLHLGELLKHIIYRINHASALYQMFGTLGDIVVLDPNQKLNSNITDKCLGAIVNDDKECQNIKFTYFENIQVQYPLAGFIGRDFPTKRGMKFPKMVHPESYLTVTLEYHPDFHGEKVFGDDRVADGLKNAHKSNFLHPIIREFDIRSDNITQCFNKNSCFNLTREHQISEHHFLEDFWGVFTLQKIHTNPFKRYLNGVLTKVPRYRPKYSPVRENTKLKRELKTLTKIKTNPVKDEL
eukprot:gene4116-7402_t